MVDLSPEANHLTADPHCLTKPHEIGIVRACFFSDQVTTKVANSAQARKRARQNESRRRHNASQRSAFRTAIKKAVAAVEAGDYDAASNAYQTAVPVIDRAVTHGLITRNKAARHKSRLNAGVKNLKG